MHLAMTVGGVRHVLQQRHGQLRSLLSQDPDAPRDFLFGHTVGQPAENVIHRDPHPTNARFTVPLVRLYRYPRVKRRHCVTALSRKWTNQALKAGHIDALDLAALHEVHNGSDLCGNRTQSRPMVARQYHYRQFAIREVLLVADVLVAGYQDFEPGLFGGFEKCSIFEVLPAQCASPGHIMSPK
jgi:hypothetical protein